jgi:hypothetical protein
MLRRFKVLGIGLILGAVFALLVAGLMMPSEMRLLDRTLVWVSVMGGPIIGTAWGISEFHPSINLGWLGLLLIPAHPLCPNTVTKCVTFLGLSLWFFAGFLTMMITVWGA